jgi:GAF domain-containing protein/HAMP domain-containing protein
MKRSLFLDQYLQRLGGWYILAVVFVAQVCASVGAILGSISIQRNADFDVNTAAEISLYTPVLILLSNLILLALLWYVTPNARRRLNDWVRNQLKANPTEELAAWREITALTMRYGTAAVPITYAVSILPPAIYYYMAARTTFEQFVYTLLGGLVSALATAIIAVLLMDYLLAPARLALVPKSFDAQLQGLSGARLTYKFLILTLILLAIVILLLGPVGFHYMNVRLPAVDQPLRRAFQLEAVIVSLIALALGTALAYFISRTVSAPLRNLIESFKTIEAGDLSHRAAITATDEIAELAMHFNRMVAGLAELQGNLEKQVQERTRLLRATNDIAKVSSSILDPDELLARVINLFTEQFNYYYAAIYLLDPSEKWAELKEATGEAGKVLKQNHHRLELTGKSMVATCIRERMPRIAQNTSEEKQRMENPLLPYTRSEIALPLIAGDHVLGALNVQSTRAADFGQQVIETMQNMTAQVAIALENAHLFQETRQRIKEMRAIQQQYLLQGWGSLSLSQEESEYAVGESNEANAQKFVSTISLRDQIIGQIDVEGSSDWSAEQKNLIDAVAAQAAIALENARLVNESRQIAVRERMLAEISSRIWSSNTIEAVLQTAVRELGRRLDASNATIRLDMNDKP